MAKRPPSVRNVFGNVGCGPKVQYLTWTQAAQAARRLQRAKDVKAHPYHCCACHRFHVGTSD